MLWVGIILAVLVFVSFIRDWDAGIPLSVSGAAVWVLIVFFSFLFHSHDVAIVRNSEMIIAAQQERIDSLKVGIAELSGIGKNTGVLFNADSPIKSMIDNLADAESELAKAKMKVIEAKVDISARKIGPLSFVVSLTGEE